MKNLAFIFITSALLLSGCKPKKKNIEPIADVETQSSAEVTWATHVITDIDQICGFIGEDNQTDHFYAPVPGSANTMTVNRHVDARLLVIGWNGAECRDGVKRDGSIFFYYQPDPQTLNASYYRDYKFVGRIQLSDYKVNGWVVSTYDPASPAYIYNLLERDNYDPKQTKLSWRIAGKFLLAHPTDPSQNIIWEGDLTKTLMNSDDPDIFHPSKQVGISWISKTGKCAMVSYHGKVNGYTSASIPFTYEVSKYVPLIRDFSCSPDVVKGLGNEKNIIKEEFHPFIKGIASFTTADKYPRQIYYGNEGTADLPPQCDNEGMALIKGNLYKIEFRK